ncbi:MAG: amidase [Nitrospinota bacterium]|nr:MAG: amidase [Nitrospinota bacterium]
MAAEELCYLSAIDLAEAIRTRKVSPVEVVDAVLDRIDRLNPRLNAYCTILHEPAREQAKAAEAALMKQEDLGPLHGVPVSIKDLTLTRGVRTTRGSKIYEHFIPDEDAPVVESLKAAGAIIIGKTNTPEFGWKGVTDNPLFGATRNPWNLDRTPGGSSGGAGAAVAAGLGPLALGTDGGGSIRIPSSFCGIFGLKPSFGRVPQYPAGWGEGLSHAGPMTRTVRDAALMLNVMARPDDRDRFSLPADGTDYLQALDTGIEGLRVAWSVNLGYAVVDPEVEEITSEAVNAFSELGCQVEAVDPGFESPERIFSIFYLAGIAALLWRAVEEWGPHLDPGLLEVIEEGKKLTAIDVMEAVFQRQAFWETVRRFFLRYDLLVTPTVAVPPFALGLNDVEIIAGQEVSPLIGWIPFTYPFNLTGQPAANVPCGWTADGLPVGLQIVGRRYADVTVLRAAAAFESVRPWADKWPAL